MHAKCACPYLSMKTILFVGFTICLGRLFDWHKYGRKIRRPRNGVSNTKRYYFLVCLSRKKKHNNNTFWGCQTHIWYDGPSHPREHHSNYGRSNFGSVLDFRSVFPCRLASGLFTTICISSNAIETSGRASRMSRRLFRNCEVESEVLGARLPFPLPRIDSSFLPCVGKTRTLVGLTNRILHKKEHREQESKRARGSVVPLPLFLGEKVKRTWLVPCACGFHISNTFCEPHLQLRSQP